MIDLRLI